MLDLALQRGRDRLGLEPRLAGEHRAPQRPERPPRLLAEDAGQRGHQVVGARGAEQLDRGLVDRDHADPSQRVGEHLGARELIALGPDEEAPHARHVVLPQGDRGFREQRPEPALALT